MNTQLDLIEELAAYVLDGEPCPERCTCGSEDGLHEDPASGDGRDALTLFVRRARESFPRVAIGLCPDCGSAPGIDETDHEEGCEHVRTCADANCPLHEDALFCEACTRWVDFLGAPCPALIEEPSGLA